MIKLSEENQIKIEKKQITSKEENETSSQDSNEEKEAVNEIDKTNWTKAAPETEYNMEAYLPFKIYQERAYSDGLKTYVDYYDDYAKQIQVNFQKGEESVINLYRWNAFTIQHYGQIKQGKKHFNYLKDGISENKMPTSRTILSGPLKVGTSWVDEDQVESEIVALYDQAKIQNQDYKNVVEVVCKEKEADQYFLFAADYGIIGSWKQANGQAQEVQIIQSTLDRVMWLDSISVYLPQTTNNEGPLVQKEKVEFAWQTNDSLASAFQRFCYDQQWIQQDIQVLDLYEADGLAHVNFSPGVVASMGQHPAGEKAVLASIITNVANYFGVKQVRMEVQGNGMLASSVPYPPNGVHQVDPTWFEQSQSSTVEEIQSTIELQFNQMQ